MNMLPAGSIVSTEEAYQIHGFKIGDSYKFATAQQRLCWKPDTSTHNPSLIASEETCLTRLIICISYPFHSSDNGLVFSVQLI